MCSNERSKIRAIFVSTMLLSAVTTTIASEFVTCMTTKGSITIEIHAEWAPTAAERFLSLVDAGFYSDIALYRSVKSFLVQFGISDKPAYRHWHNEPIPDDPNMKIPIARGMVSFAGSGRDSRTTQLFIAYSNLPFLGTSPWETPFGVVVHGYDTLDAFTTVYGDMPPYGQGPDQMSIYKQGNTYLREIYPELDYILWCDRAYFDDIPPFLITPDEPVGFTC